MSATEGVVVCGSVGGNGPLRKGPQISWSCERYARFAQVCAVHSDPSEHGLCRHWGWALAYRDHVIRLAARGHQFCTSRRVRRGEGVLEVMHAFGPAVQGRSSGATRRPDKASRRESFNQNMSALRHSLGRLINDYAVLPVSSPPHNLGYSTRKNGDQ